jgi:hypothetical protein
VSRYDGAAINAHWGNTWPTETDPAKIDILDPRNEWSPVLGAEVANRLGDGWVLECGSPGGDYVTWYRPEGESNIEIGICPMVTDDDLVEWTVEITREDADGSDVHVKGTEFSLATPYDELVTKIRAFIKEDL